MTGSARLDYYRKGGDSLLGRYRYLRLHPLSVAELKLKSSQDLDTLLKFGGFPEPFFKASERNWRLWQKERLHRIVNDDIRDLENLREYQSIELLAENLSNRIGSLLSINSLSEDLEFNFRTIERWIQILERIYYCFRVPPYGSPKIKALKKSQKIYLWDWSSCEDKGSQFENFVASHLLKYCHYQEDSEGFKMELRYIRNQQNREIDFVVLKEKKPLFAVECKVNDTQLSPHIKYFKKQLKIPKYYQVHLGKKDYEPHSDVRVLPFIKFSQEVGLV